LEITVDGNTLAPRQPVTPTPYALFSNAPWATRDGRREVRRRIPEASRDGGSAAARGVALSARVVGADIFVRANLQPAELGPKIETLLEGSALKLKMISNRGTTVYPSAGAITDCVDQFRCRCILREVTQKGGTATLTGDQLLPVLAKVGTSKEPSWMHIEKLQEIDGTEGFTKAQGED